jgi:hypothetical protein
MDADAHSPEWSLLPHDPQAFFGLADAFDRKDLKRAYNRLIRQYKPEKFPQEFQRIRAAYELLDNHLRYGAALSSSGTAERYTWQTDEAAAKGPRGRSDAGAGATSKSATPGADKVEAGPTVLPLQVRLRKEPLPDLYRELAAKQHKLPYDFYALAVMSDIVQRKDGLQFVRWVLQGLGEHRRDQALLSLLYEYLRGPVPIEAASGLLTAVSKVVRTDAFFALTESLWRRLLRERPFAEFAATLRACETNLRDVAIDGRLAFTVELLKAAIWVADREWIDGAFTLIEENFERIPPQVQYDLDVLDMLKKYVTGRPAMGTALPLRRRIDDALRAYFSGDEATRDRSVLECAVEIAQSPEKLLEAFPMDSGEDYSNFYVLWSIVTGDVGERYAPEAPAADVQAWISRGRALYEGVEQRVKASGLYRRSVGRQLGYIVGMGVAYVVAFFVSCMVGIFALVSIGGDSFAVQAAAVFGSVGAALGAVYFVQRRYLRPRWAAYTQRQQGLWYSTISRGELAAFLQRSRFTRDELKELMFSADIRNLSLAQTTADHFQQDYGLAIYAMAMRFQI